MALEGHRVASTSLRTAGLSGFLTLSHALQRPEVRRIPRIFGAIRESSDRDFVTNRWRGSVMLTHRFHLTGRLDVGRIHWWPIRSRSELADLIGLGNPGGLGGHQIPKHAKRPAEGGPASASRRFLRQVGLIARPTVGATGGPSSTAVGLASSVRLTGYHGALNRLPSR